MPASRTIEDCTAVILTQSKWDELPRIRHQVAYQLSRFCPVIFAETPVDWRIRQRFSEERITSNLVRYSLSNKRIPRTLLRRVEPINQFVQKAFMREVLSQVRAGARGSVVLINFNYDLGRVAADARLALSVYFCNDDFAMLQPNRRSRQAVARQEHLTSSSADLCLAVSVPIVKKLQCWNPNTHLYLPGHAFSVGPQQMTGHRHLNGLTRVGFMGFINDRLLFEWLQLVADQPDMRLDLIGPVERTSSRLESLLNSSRVTHRPALTGPALQRALEEYDVLVMPYDPTEGEYGMAAVTAPNKLFAYLAVGKPIVISAMPHFIDFGPGIIYQARTAREFVEVIRRSSEEDCDELRQKRTAIAQDNTWDIRGDQLREHLDRMLREPRHPASNRSQARRSR
jgi:glycosyltransferase involved in cell wall biosynthesis